MTTERKIFGAYTLEELVEIMELSFVAGVRWADWAVGNQQYYDTPPPDKQRFVNSVIGEAYRKIASGE